MKRIWDYISLKGKFEISTQQIISTTAMVLGLFHVALWIFYICFGITEMIVINAVSILMYIFCYIGSVKGKDLLKIFNIMFFEIVIHAIVATFYVGIDCGFMLYLIAVIPIGYYVTYSFREVLKKVNPVFYVLVGIATFWITRVVYRFIEPKYNLGNIVFDRAMYMVNYTAIAAGIVAFCSTIVGKVIYLEEKQRLQNRLLEELARVDPLTGLANRRSIQDRYEESEALEEEYAIILGDIDDFKKVNDTYGHDVGDEVLKEVAGVFKKVTRNDDIVCRWGGEEILIYLPNATKEQAVAVADRILSMIREIEMFGADNQRFFVTMTLGVAVSSETGGFKETVKMADERMYEGKHTGKDRIIS